MSPVDIFYSSQYFMKKNVTISKDCLIVLTTLVDSAPFLKWALPHFDAIDAKEGMNRAGVHFQKTFYQKN